MNNRLEEREDEVNIERQVMKLSRDKVGEVERLKYLRYILQKDYGFQEDIKYRIKCG